MRLNPNAPGGAAANPVTEDRGGGTQANSPALIGMSLRQDIPGGLLSSRARFRFTNRCLLCDNALANCKKAFAGI